ncbi:MAG: hypothetical protein ACLTKI_08710, partial [Lachnospiraceae bacterium]
MKKKMIRILTALVLLSSLSMPGNTFAASKTAISNIELTFTSTLQIGARSGAIYADCQTGLYRVTDCAIQNEPAVWSGRETPIVNVTLKSDDDYYFSKTGKHAFTLLGEGASYDSAVIEDSGSKLVLTVHFATLDSTGQPHWEHDGIGWWYAYEDGTCPVNTWQQVEEEWYYFDENGYMSTGWILWEENWY